MKKFFIFLFLFIILSFVNSIDNYDSYLGLYCNKYFQILEISKSNNQFYLDFYNINKTSDYHFKIKFYKDKEYIYFSLDASTDEFNNKDFKVSYKNSVIFISLKYPETNDLIYYKVDNSLTRDNYFSLCNFYMNKKGYFLDSKKDYLYYIYSDYPKLKIIRYKLINFTIVENNDSDIFLKNNIFYANFDNIESKITFTSNLLKINNNNLYEFGNLINEKSDINLFGNNILLAKYNFNKIINKNINVISEKINEEYYNKSIIIITRFGIFIFSDIKSTNVFVFSNNNFFDFIPNGSQIDDFMIENYGIQYLNKIDNFPNILTMKYKKHEDKYSNNKSVIINDYSFEIEYIKEK